LFVPTNQKFMSPVDMIAAMDRLATFSMPMARLYAFDDTGIPRIDAASPTRDWSGEQSAAFPLPRRASRRGS
jgi:hypothetical protein